MKHHLTPEQAKARADAILAALHPDPHGWDTALLDQAVLALADDGRPFGMNDVRLLVPEDVCRGAGLYFHSFTTHDQQVEDRDRYLIWCGDVVSINPKARGKKVGTYRLTAAGRAFIEARQAARGEQQRRAAA